MKKRKSKDELLSLIRDGMPMTRGEQLRLTAVLSVPAVMAQISTIVMQYIDAAMVGSLGARASASIGIVSTTTWLFFGLCAAVVMGFSVQVAHLIGAGRRDEARRVLQQSLVFTQIFSAVLLVAGCAVSGVLPYWLGGEEAIAADASAYFLVFSLSLPFLQLNYLAGGMLRSTGNIFVPGALNVLMCLLDVVFNRFLIFPSEDVEMLGLVVHIPGADLGVTGAAIGTALAEVVTGLLMMWFLYYRSPELRLTGVKKSFRLTSDIMRRAVRIGTPLSFEHVVVCGAQILTTVIVAPLGMHAISANAFAITAEALCYMPGFGIADAATTLVGQSLGAGRKELARRFAYITVGVGMGVMTVMGVVMYVAAPLMMGVFTPDETIRSLGVTALRTEAFAEPMFAASIVAYGVFVGAGDTLVPSCMKLVSIWGVRLTLAAALAPSMGLHGVWIAMCIELCFRGVIFLVRLHRGKWLDKWK